MRDDQFKQVVDGLGPLTCDVSEDLVDVLARRLKDLSPGAKQRFDVLVELEVRQRIKEKLRAHAQLMFEQLRDALDVVESRENLAEVRLMCSLCITAIDAMSTSAT